MGERRARRERGRGADGESELERREGGKNGEKERKGAKINRQTDRRKDRSMEQSETCKQRGAGIIRKRERGNGEKQTD